ncbi:aryl-alcohol dehydrogenase [Cohnella pontilimi]|uniref:Aryl-alcohol dehydrogenase n=1 Tax=Cohnella pontilimi TaxID=2564100 RepID=A0A4U0FEK1_9BACL|nr:aldo/keto reductase [Cohnella pontilimi]TJY42744.1 aryl-alcohol dehydrogenase [Cohnella pontilimi]
MKLAIGSQLFGMDPDTRGDARISPQEVQAILAYARRAALDMVDTAPDYGRSEFVLGAEGGEALPRKIVTKTPVFHSDSIGYEDMLLLTTSFSRSLWRLRTSRIYGLVVQRGFDLMKPGAEAIYAQLKQWKAEGKVEKIGVFVRDAQELDALLSQYAFDIVQLPVNVLDQRMPDSGALRRLKLKGVEIHARSVFSDGLLLTKPEELPSRYASYRDHLEQYHGKLQDRRMQPVEAALLFIRSVPQIDYAIVEINSLAHLKEVHAAFAVRAGLDFPFRRFALNEELNLMDSM